MATIFVFHTFRADPATSRLLTKAIARQLALEGHLPLAPQFYLPVFLNEATERRLALDLCFMLVALADEVRVYGRPSEGMYLEIAEAHRLGIPVVAGSVEGETALIGEPPR